MSTTVSFNNSNYTIPAVGERSWGNNVSNFLIAVGGSALSKAGGAFTLSTADVNFGASFGLVSAYYKSRTANISTTGILRLANNEGIGWRNAANGADKILKLDAGDRLEIDGVDIVTVSSTDTLTNKTLSGNTATNLISGSGTLTLNTSGTVTVPNGTDTLVGKATTDTLTNKTLTAPIISTISNTGTLTLPTSTDTLVGRATTDTLTNKTLTSPSVASPTFTDYTLFSEVSAPSTPASGKVAVYAKTDKKMYRKGSDGVETEIGSGAGSGEINYISNADFETGATTGWATYKDAAAATPADGTGGSPTTLTLSANSSSPMRGNYDFKVAKSAANSQGEGFSYDFSIKTPDKSKKLKIQFDLNSSDSNFTAGDVVIYVYDVTNATLITPSSTSLPKVGASTYQVTFDSTTSTSYRLIFHWAVTTATAVNLYFDSFVVGPGVVVQGAAVSEWQTYTPTLTNGGTTSTNTGRWRRVGSSMEIQTYAVFTGAGSASAFSVSLPSGYSVDTSAVPAGTNVPSSSVGTAHWSNASVEAILMAYYQTATTPNSIKFIAQSASANFLGNVLASGHELGMKVMVPIAEWAGNGTVNLGPGAQVEYAYNTSTTDAPDTTSFGYGPAGGQFGSFTALRTKRVQFQYPIQQGDELILEVSGDAGVTWLPVGQSSVVHTFQQPNGVFYGAYVDAQSSTQASVIFGTYRINSATTYAGAGTTWAGIASSATYLWRVKKCKPSSPVGFSLAGSTASGLVTAEVSQGTFTMYLRDGSTSTSATAYYSRVGNLVTLHIPAMTLTTTATAMYLSSSSGSNTWPSDITPVRATQDFGAFVQETSTLAGGMEISTGGVCQIYKGAFAVFSASSLAKGSARNTVSYLL